MSIHKKNLIQYKNLVDTIRIDHADFLTVKARLTQAYEDVGSSATPICLHIVGETRTGKSCVIKDFLQGYKRTWQEEGARQAVVYAAAPPKATVKALLEQLLRGLGDPHWNK
ncbi:MAG: TniB family NTP-binding protein, partial [Arenimonas sp.]